MHKKLVATATFEVDPERLSDINKDLKRDA